MNLKGDLQNSPITQICAASHYDQSPTKNIISHVILIFILTSMVWMTYKVIFRFLNQMQINNYFLLLQTKNLTQLGIY